MRMFMMSASVGTSVRGSIPIWWKNEEICIWKIESVFPYNFRLLLWILFSCQINWWIIINALLPSTQIFPIREFYLGLPTSLLKINGTSYNLFLLLSQIFSLFLSSWSSAEKFLIPFQKRKEKIKRRIISRLLYFSMYY